MRILTTLDNAQTAQNFSAYLSQEGIENTLEPTYDTQQEKGNYSIWIHDEDDFAKASDQYAIFQKDPHNPIYNVKEQTPPPPQETITDPSIEEEKRPPPSKQGVTFFFVFLCIVIFFYSGVQSLQRKDQPVIIRYTPVQLTLFYDIPLVVTLLENLLEDEPNGIYSNPETLSEETLSRIKSVEKTPIWKGFYALLLPKAKEDAPLLSYPPFRLILKGQVWRVFTPCLLHGDIFHIIFNMIFLWILGRQAENRLSSFRMVFLILLLGIVSNTAQYLMSGPFFLGFSGVGLGLAGFVWMRQKIAPWEGHLIHSSVFVFLTFYVLALFLYQLLAFFLAVTKLASLPPFVIANTAHITGGLFGICLGRLSFFSWRPKNE